MRKHLVHLDVPDPCLSSLIFNIQQLKFEQERHHCYNSDTDLCDLQVAEGGAVHSTRRSTATTERVVSLEEASTKEASPMTFNKYLLAPVSNKGTSAPMKGRGTLSRMICTVLTASNMVCAGVTEDGRPISNHSFRRIQSIAGYLLPSFTRFRPINRSCSG